MRTHKFNIPSLLRHRCSRFLIAALSLATACSAPASADEAGSFTVGVSSFMPIAPGVVFSNIESSGALLVEYTTSSEFALRAMVTSLRDTELCVNLLFFYGSCAYSATDNGYSVDALLLFGKNLATPGWRSYTGVGLHTEKWQDRILHDDTRSAVLAGGLGYGWAGGQTLEGWVHYYTGSGSMDFAFGLALIYRL
jgi:hypothetical protein